MRPWEGESMEAVRALIRGAALAEYYGQTEDWVDLRVSEGWSEDDIGTFINEHRTEITRTKKQFERWLDGETELL